MPLRRANHGKLIYIGYQRESYPDYEKLKRELGCLQETVSEENDVVVDFTGSDDIGSPEMSSLVRLVQCLMHLGRYVRVVATPSVRERISWTNLDRLPGVKMYASRDQLRADLGDLADFPI